MLDCDFYRDLIWFKRIFLIIGKFATFFSRNFWLIKPLDATLNDNKNSMRKISRTTVVSCYSTFSKHLHFSNTYFQFSRYIHFLINILPRHKNHKSPLKIALKLLISLLIVINISIYEAIETSNAFKKVIFIKFTDWKGEAIETHF